MPDTTASAAATPPARAHRAFSPRRILTMASGTFTQLVRMKVFAFMAIFSVIVIASSFVFADMKTEGQLKLLKDVSLASMALFSMLFAIAGTALLIPRDIEDRTLYTILCKPVPRLEYLLGKLVGVAMLLAVSLLLMDGLMVIVLYLKEKSVFASQVEVLQMIKYPTVEEFQRAVTDAERIISTQGLRWGLQVAVVSIFLKSVVLTAVTLLVSTFASSTIFTIMSSLAIMVIGQVQSLARSVLMGEGEPTLIPRLIAGAVSLLFPDFKTFDVVDAVVVGNAVPMSVVYQMTGLTAIYVTLYMMASYILFSDKEL